MMKKLFLSVMAWAIIIWCAGAAIAANNDVGQKLKAAFPDIAFKSVTQSPVKGIYEVVLEDGILYFAPQEGIIFSGQMFDKTKRNLTAERLQGIIAKSYENISQKATGSILL
jgi:hypothetical protein